MPLLSDLFGLPGAGQQVPIGGLDGELPPEVLAQIARIQNQGPMVAPAALAPAPAAPPPTVGGWEPTTARATQPLEVDGIEPSGIPEARALNQGVIDRAAASRAESVPVPVQPQQPQGGPSAMDRLQGFVTGYGQGGLLGGIAGASRGVDRQHEAENLTVKALMARDIPEQEARAAVRNPELAQKIIAKAYADRTVTLGANQIVGDPRTGRIIFDTRDAAKPILRNVDQDVLSPDGRTVLHSGQQKPKELAPADLRKLQEDGSSLANLKTFLSTFKPEYGGHVLGGDIRNWSGRNMPEAISGPYAEQAKWWQAYKRNSELTERHALFGAALTPGEQEQWRQADINPNMSPKAIRDNLEFRKGLLERGLKNYANSLIQSRYDAAPIAAALGLDLKELGVTTERQRGATSIGGGERPNPTQALREAQDAINQGADPKAVFERLRQMGIQGAR